MTLAVAADTMVSQRGISRCAAIIGGSVNISTDDCHNPKRVAELKPCSATEALRRDAVDLQVDDDEQLVLSPTDRSHHSYFARIRLQAFDDLQVLGLVPRGLRQEAIRTAIAADDEAVQRLAEERVRRGDAAAPCGCSQSGGRSLSFSASLRASYQALRRDYNPALARVLSNHYGTELAWDSHLAISVRGWTSRFSKEALVTVALFRDIQIGRNARLDVEASSVELLARNIRIHRSGTLSHHGGYLRIWANSIETYLLEVSDIVHAEKAIWALNH
jgi:hypothetical protein